MSNRVQERPRSSKCIVTTGKSHGIAFKILEREHLSNRVQERPRSSKSIIPTATHKTLKMGRHFPVHEFYSRYWKNLKKSHWIFQCSITLSFYYCICYSCYTFAEILFTGYASKQHTSFRKVT